MKVENPDGWGSRFCGNAGQIQGWAGPRLSLLCGRAPMREREENNSKASATIPDASELMIFTG
jgi:hypothetical protein